MSHQLIGNEAQLCQMLDSIIKLSNTLPSGNPFLFIDLEGIDLSRHGCISIMQILIPPMSTVYLLDVHILKDKTFNTCATDGTTLKQLLQCTDWVKVFFDVRNDSDALFSHFAIDLKCVIDIQLLEFATRPRAGRFLNGLSRCIEYDAPMDYADLAKWSRVKDAGKRLFAPELGGSYQVFLERPLPEAVAQYCAQDVLVMPKLLLTYGKKLKERKSLAQKICDESEARIVLSQSPTYVGKGQHKAIGPNLNTRSSRGPSHVRFPMSVVCSGTLSTYCTIDETKKKGEEGHLVAGLEALSVASGRKNEVGRSHPLLSGCREDVATKNSVVVPKDTQSLGVLAGVRAEVVADERNDGDERRRPSITGYLSRLDEDSDGCKDLTACDKECGYCGRCMY